MEFCRKCGKESLEGDDQFCSRCGATLGNSVAEKRSETPTFQSTNTSPTIEPEAQHIVKPDEEPRSKRKMAFVVLAAVSIVVLTVAGIWIFSRSQVNRQEQTVTKLTKEIGYFCQTPLSVDRSHPSSGIIILCPIDRTPTDNVSIVVLPSSETPQQWFKGSTCAIAAVVETSNFQIIPFNLVGPNWIAQGSVTWTNTANLMNIQSIIGGKVIGPSGSVEILDAVHQYPSGCSA